jgi:hypothetical protein
LIGAADKCYPDLVKRQKAFDKISEALTGLCYARAHMAIEHELFKRGWKSIVAFNDCTLTTFQQLREVIIAANV